ncbi:MAG: hypothetical protein AAGH15_24540, partial [Myxococcota bacterium]
LAGSAGASVTPFHPVLFHGTARLAYGVSEWTDLSAEATAVVVTDRTVTGVASDAFPAVLSLRLGAKQAFTRHLAFSLGVGAGGSAGGGHVSPDVGVVAGYDNPYVVPFGSFRAFASVPFAAREVAFRDNEAGLVVLRPESSTGFAWMTGVRVSVGVLPAGGRRRGAFIAGFGGTTLYSGDTRITWFSGQLGFELRLAE